MTSSSATSLLIMIFYVATSAWAAQAPPVPHPARTPDKPQIVFPLATRPGTDNGGIKDVIVGPTDNISAVANHIDVQAKSLTVEGQWRWGGDGNAVMPAAVRPSRAAPQRARVARTLRAMMWDPLNSKGPS